MFGIFRTGIGLLLLTVGPACADPLVPPVESSTDERAVARVLRLMHTQGADWVLCPTAQERGPKEKEQTAASVLIQMMRSEDPGVRMRAIEGFAGTATPAAIDAMILALRDPDLAVRNAAGSALSTVEPAALIDRVVAVLFSGDDRATQTLTDVLPALRGRLESGMLHVLESDLEPPERQIAAAYSLGYMKSTAAVEGLTRRAWSTNGEVAIYSAEALCTIQDPRCLQTFIELLQHPLADVRECALDGIADIGGPKSIIALAYVASGHAETDRGLCQEAASLLGRIGDASAVPLLIQVIQMNPNVQATAAQSLRRLTGEQLGDNPGDWVAWSRARFGEKQPEPGKPTPPNDSDVLALMEPFGLPGGMDAVSLFGLAPQK